MVRRFRTRLLALSLALFAATSALAGDVAEFVFLIDLSPRMSFRKTATISAARDLAATGIHGRMKDGERLAVWFYDQTIYTNPPIVWDSRRAEEFGDAVAGLFAGKKFTKPAQIKPAVTNVLAASPKVTALFLTDGNSTFSGSPFDAEINSAFAQNHARFARAGKPFLVTLMARKGEWVAWGVHTALGEPVQLPAMPIDPAVLARAVEVLRTPPPAPKKVEIPTPIKPVEVVIQPKPPEIPKPLVVEKTITPPEPEPIVVAPKIEEPSPQPTPRSEPELKQEQIVTNVARPVAIVVAVAPIPKSSPWPLFLAAFGVLAATGATIYLRISQPKKERPRSLITRAFDSEER